MPTKVLVADDSLKVQKELTQLLKEAGIETVTVSNGEHAVRKLPTEKPDLVLADLFMPVRTGYEVCEYIKNSEEFGHVAVLLLASKMEPYDEAEAKRVRADGKVEKPFADPGAVLATIQQHLEKVAAQKPAPPPPPIEEFAQAVPSAEAQPEPEPEPEQFSTRPPPVSFEAAAPMGFADVEEEAPAAAPPAEPAPAEPPVDLSQATMLTTAEELQKRSAGEEPEAPPAPPAEETAPAEPAPPPVAGFEPPPPPPAGEQTKIDKPEVAAPWEMTGPEPGAPEIPAAGGWDSQWKGGEEEAAAAAEAPPAEEAPAAPAGEEKPYAPEEFAAAFGATGEPAPAAAEEAPPEETHVSPPPAAEAPAEEAPAAEPAPAAAPAEPTPAAAELDPAVVDQVVNQVLERLSPQVMDTIAREIVRPLAENLLKEKFQK